jgi:3-hydroxyacyl-CoA dehydrogenase
MNYEDRLENVTVLGAAGKMGSGILLLTAVEMADLALKPENRDRQFVLNAVDVSHQALTGLMGYLRSQVRRLAEKKTVLLRKLYADRQDLIENAEIIDQYIFDVISLVRPGTAMAAAHESTLIFEAVNENIDLKVKLLSQIDGSNSRSPWFFTNTSSIPIHELDKKAGLGGRVLGFHFYNPPAVQKLVELIVSAKTLRDLEEFAHTYAKNLRKKVVPANDFAGFIGNGHFMRDILHGLSEVERLVKEADMSFVEAVYAVNKIGQEFLVRPMGIFQLIDYVGIDVCQFIMKVMNPYLPDEDLHSPLLDRLMELGVKGGQHADGSQKDGFLQYEKGKPAAVYDPDNKKYAAVTEFQDTVDAKIGALPGTAAPWKKIIADPSKEEKLQNYFKELEAMDTLGARLARRYAARSREIGLQLVNRKVANTEDDVNTVLLTGFYHAYGPINDYLNWEEIQ